MLSFSMQAHDTQRDTKMVHTLYSCMCCVAVCTVQLYALYSCIIMRQQQFTYNDERQTRDKCLQYTLCTEEQVNKSRTPT
jgi:hypothetical protein